MSNTKPWRAKQRTSKPNSRQKRNGLYLDTHPTCQRCWSSAAVHAHHMLWKGHPSRNMWLTMQALCEPCHVLHHKVPSVSFQKIR